MPRYEAKILCVCRCIFSLSTYGTYHSTSSWRGNSLISITVFTYPPAVQGPGEWVNVVHIVALGCSPLAASCVEYASRRELHYTIIIWAGGVEIEKNFTSNSSDIVWTIVVTCNSACGRNICMCVCVCVFELKQRVGSGAAQLSPGWRLLYHAPLHTVSQTISHCSTFH